MIIVSSPFPSISYHYTVDSLDTNNNSYVTSNTECIDSIGVNSTYCIKTLQDEPLLLTNLGGVGGRTIKHSLDTCKIKSHSIWIDGNTTHKINIHESRSDKYYSIINANTGLLQKDLLVLSHKLTQNIQKIKTLVVLDELESTACDYSIYKDWIKEAKEHNVKTIFSTGRQDVLDSLDIQLPYVLMFTQSNLDSLRYDTSSNTTIIAAVRPLLDKGVHYIAVYLKNQESLLISKNKCCLVSSKDATYKCQNSYQEGSFLGALSIGINRKYEMEKIAKISLGAALATSDTKSQCKLTRKCIEEYTKKTKIKELKYI